MSIELTLLAWSLVLFVLYIGVQASQSMRQYGTRDHVGGRDELPPPDAMHGRARRALSNFIETYGLFVALVAVSAISGRSNTLTVLGAHLYFWARIAYLPLYLFAIAWWRSLVWWVGFTGLILLCVGVLV